MVVLLVIVSEQFLVCRGVVYRESLAFIMGGFRRCVFGCAVVVVEGCVRGFWWVPVVYTVGAC